MQNVTGVRYISRLKIQLTATKDICDLISIGWFRLAYFEMVRECCRLRQNHITIPSVL
jgi:hypothetical protein